MNKWFQLILGACAVLALVILFLAKRPLPPAPVANQDTQDVVPPTAAAPAPRPVMPKPAPVEVQSITLPPGIQDQGSLTLPLYAEYVNNWSDGQTFTVTHNGLLSGVVIAACADRKGVKIPLEIRPLRNRWPTESPSLTLAAADALLPLSPRTPGMVLHADDWQKCLVAVMFKTPLHVHAGDQLAVVIPATHAVAASVGMTDDAGYPAGSMFSNNNDRGWDSPTVAGRKLYFRTFIIPDDNDKSAPEPHGALTATAPAPLAPPAPPAAEASPLPHVAVAWQPSRWQPLPQAVQDVTVGPDQRLWLDYQNGPAFSTLEQAKKVVEQEFTNLEPHLLDMVPVLFEPNGRVWFTTVRHGQNLVAYDGHAWLDYSIPAGDEFHGVAPGHPCPSAASPNALIDGHAFFPSRGIVHCFDGKSWSEQIFWTSDVSSESPRLVPEPDGKGLLVAARWNPYKLWRWRNGKWSPVGLPPSLAGKPIYQVAPIDNTSAYIYCHDEALHRITYGPAPTQPSVPVVNKHTSTTDYKPTILGEYTASYLDNSPIVLGQGITLLSSFHTSASSHVQRIPEGEGLFILGPALKVRFVAGHHAARWGQPHTDENAFLASKTAAWVDGEEIDLADGKIIDTVPQKDCAKVVACTAAGAVFFEGGRGQIFAYKYQGPGKPALAAADPHDQSSINHPRDAGPAYHPVTAFALDLQGRMWTPTAEGMSSYDGKQHQVVPGSAFKKPLGPRPSIACGDNAVVIVSNWNDHGESVLLINNSLHRADTLRNLISENIDLIAKAFGPKTWALNSRNRQAFRILADKKRNIWVVGLPGQNPVVFDGADWITLPHGNLRGFWAFGDGSQMVVAGVTNPNYWMESLSVEAGALKTDPRPQEPFYFADYTVENAKNQIWVSAPRQGGADSYKTLATLISPQGVVDEIPGCYIVLCDDSGNTWTVDDNKSEHLSVWRNGKIQCTLNAYGANAGSRYTSAGPGSVYALSQDVLTHFVADKQHPGQYRQVDSTPLGFTNVRNVELSKLGFATFVAGEIHTLNLP